MKERRSGSAIFGGFGWWALLSVHFSWNCISNTKGLVPNFNAEINYRSILAASEGGWTPKEASLNPCIELCRHLDMVTMQESSDVSKRDQEPSSQRSKLSELMLLKD